MLNVADIADFLGQFAPLPLAGDWDNVGLLLGAASAPVKSIMTCLTLTPESAAEAVAAGADLVVTHHPILFRAVKRLTASTVEGKMLLELARANVAVYSPHTAFDNCTGGINDIIARKIGLTDIKPLRTQEGARRCKIVVFVPDKDLGKVSEALFEAGAGQIGQYSQCSFRLPGTGTFFGSDAANPTVGVKGRREEVSEWRLEAVCRESDVARVTAALRQAHSYEEPAYDVYPLKSEPGSQGMGRIGTLGEAVNLQTLAKTVQQLLGASSVQIVGDPKRMVRQVAVVCGTAVTLSATRWRRRQTCC